MAVLGSTTADDLGIGADGVGSTITIDGLPYTVVGILQAKGGTGFVSQDDQVLVPLGTVSKYFTGSDTVRSVAVSIASADEMTAATDAITAVLRTRHALAAADTSDFTIVTQAQLLSTVGDVTGILTALLAGIASISLVVGGIGIMNIMLVSVRERTREIGIRKAIGAKRRDILLQFLIEALTLSMLGGVVGVVVGLVVSAVIDRIAGWPLVVNPTTVVVAVGFSASSASSSASGRRGRRPCSTRSSPFVTSDPLNPSRATGPQPGEPMEPMNRPTYPGSPDQPPAPSADPAGPATAPGAQAPGTRRDPWHASRRDRRIPRPGTSLPPRSRCRRSCRR